MQLRKFLQIFLISLLISGCSLLKPKTITVTKLVQKDIVVAPMPKPVVLNDVKFYVVTEQSLRDFKNRFEKEHSDFVFIALSVKDYENMALNMSEIKRYIEQQKSIILYYEESIKE